MAPKRASKQQQQLNVDQFKVLNKTHIRELLSLLFALHWFRRGAMSSPFRFFRGPVRRDRDLCVFITAVDFGLWSEVFHGIVCVCVYCCSTCYKKLFAWGERDSGGHVLREIVCLLCVFITTVPVIKLFAWGIVEDITTCVCVCV